MNVLLCVDDDALLESLIQSLKWCARIRPGDRVLVTHVVPALRWRRRRDEADPGWAGRTRAIAERVELFLKETVRRLAAEGIEAKPVQLEGDVVEEILEAAREQQAELIVIGALAQEDRENFLIGAIAQKVKALAQTDVLIVRGGAVPAGKFRALIATDGSPESLRAVESFATKIHSESADIQVLNVLEVPVDTWGVAVERGRVPVETVPPVLQERAEAALAGCRDRLERHGLSADSRIVRGRPAAEILAEAERLGAHLIVLGSRGESGIRGVLLGSVTQRVTRHATCSVLVSQGPQREKAEHGVPLEGVSPSPA